MRVQHILRAAILNDEALGMRFIKYSAIPISRTIFLSLGHTFLLLHPQFLELPEFSNQFLFLLEVRENGILLKLRKNNLQLLYVYV